jgi:hypothetical protein
MYASTIGSIWTQAEERLKTATRIVIIGYLLRRSVGRLLRALVALGARGHALRRCPPPALRKSCAIRASGGQAAMVRCVLKSRHIRLNRVTVMARSPCKWRDSVL